MEEEKNEEIQEEEELNLPDVAEGEEDTTDWKELALKQQGINKRLKTKMAKAKETEKTPEKPDLKETKTEFDYGQKAFINNTLGVDLRDEGQVKLVADYISNGKTLDDLLTNKHFSNDLNEMKEAAKAKDAVPSSSKRSASSDKSVVDYWLTKPFEEVPQEMRAEVLNKRLERESQKQMYAT